MRSIILFSILALSGCAQNYIRITEYSGATLAIPGTNAAAGGCMVSTKGTVPPGTITYNGERCVYVSESAVTP